MTRLVRQNEASPWVLGFLAAAVVLFVYYWPNLYSNMVGSNYYVFESSTAPQESEQNENLQIITDSAMLVAPNGIAAIQDKNVMLENLEVNSAAGNGKLFWVSSPGTTELGNASGRDLLVYLENGLVFTGGASVNIEGTVRATPTIEEITANWNFTNEEAEEAYAKGFYIHAESVQATNN